MTHLRFEGISDDAELVARRRLIDYLQGRLTRQVNSRARAFTRAHCGAEIEDKGVAAALTGRRRRHHV